MKNRSRKWKQNTRKRGEKRRNKWSDFYVANDFFVFHHESPDLSGDLGSRERKKDV